MLAAEQQASGEKPARAARMGATIMALDPNLFAFLNVYNGDWVALPRYNNLNPLVNGTEATVPNSGNDKIVLTGGLLNLNVTVNGLSGNDYIDSRTVGIVNALNGGDGSDQIFGGAGNNTITGGNGNDYIEGGAGLLDTLNGGAGTDTLSYENSGAAVTVNMTQLTAGLVTVSGGHANGDLVSNNFENVVGSAHNDTITGNLNNNVLIGLAGNDTLNGVDGNDTLIGGIGNDQLFGGEGHDFLRGGAGADQLNGGDGGDTADYSNSAAGVTVDLSLGIGSGGDALDDTFNSIENITGSAFGDVIFGANDGDAQILRGGAGDDHIVGVAPAASPGQGITHNTIIGGAGADSLDGTSTFTNGAVDTFVYESSADSTPTAFDSVELQINDFFDLSPIDADPTAVGDQEFVKVAQFTGVRGQLVTKSVTELSGFIEVDIDGNRSADMKIAWEFSFGSPALADPTIIL
jgi:Ca2+-binding RTX toxin-like protein